jgi:acyl-CoA thioesterase FadM
VLVLIDAKSRRPVPIPAEVRSLIAGFHDAG